MQCNSVAFFVKWFSSHASDGNKWNWSLARGVVAFGCLAASSQVEFQLSIRVSGIRVIEMRIPATPALPFDKDSARRFYTFYTPRCRRAYEPLSFDFKYALDSLPSNKCQFLTQTRPPRFHDFLQIAGTHSVCAQDTYFLWHWFFKCDCNVHIRIAQQHFIFYPIQLV